MKDPSQNEIRGEVICRFCPHVQRNVILIRTFGVGPDRFSCLQREGCEMRERVGCIDVEKNEV